MLMSRFGSISYIVATSGIVRYLKGVLIDIIFLLHHYYLNITSTRLGRIIQRFLFLRHCVYICWMWNHFFLHIRNLIWYLYKEKVFIKYIQIYSKYPGSAKTMGVGQPNTLSPKLKTEYRIEPSIGNPVSRMGSDSFVEILFHEVTLHSLIVFWFLKLKSTKMFRIPNRKLGSFVQQNSLKFPTLSRYDGTKNSTNTSVSRRKFKLGETGSQWVSLTA